MGEENTSTLRLPPARLTLDGWRAITIHTASRSKPPAQSKGKPYTHTHTDIGIHPCIQTYIHADTHPDIHGKSVSLAPYRLGSNLRSGSREEMLTGLTCLRSVSQSVSVSVCLGLSRSVRFGLLVSVGWSVYLFRSVCLGVSVSVCLSRSVSLCLGRAGHTDERTHTRCQ